MGATTCPTSPACSTSRRSPTSRCGRRASVPTSRAATPRSAPATRPSHPAPPTTAPASRSTSTSARAPPAQAFARRTGTDAHAGSVYLGLPQIVEANESTDFEAEVGALGDALEDAGYSRAVIANGDGVELPTPAPESDDEPDEASRRFRRAAVAALMGDDGTVPEGRSAKHLLEDDAERRLRCAARQRRRRRRVRGGVEAEVGRVGGSAPTSSAPTPTAISVASDQRARVLTHALRASDALVGRLLDSVDPARDAVVVVGPGRIVGRRRAHDRRGPRSRFRTGVAPVGHDPAHRLRPAHGHEPHRPRPARRRAARLDARARRRSGRRGRQRGRPARLPRRRQRRVDVPRPHRERGPERLRGARLAARGRGRRRAVAATLPMAADRVALVRVGAACRTSPRCTWHGCSRSRTWAWPRTGCSSWCAPSRSACCTGSSRVAVISTR